MTAALNATRSAICVRSALCRSLERWGCAAGPATVETTGAASRKSMIWLVRSFGNTGTLPASRASLRATQANRRSRGLRSSRSASGRRGPGRTARLRAAARTRSSPEPRRWDRAVPGQGGAGAATGGATRGAAALPALTPGTTTAADLSAPAGVERPAADVGRARLASLRDPKPQP